MSTNTFHNETHTIFLNSGIVFQVKSDESKEVGDNYFFYRRGVLVGHVKKSAVIALIADGRFEDEFDKGADDHNAPTIN